jgi:hypothetical protein
VDELNQEESRSLLDFIPTSAQLAPGCYILLTSRPKEACPDWIWRRLEDRVEGLVSDIFLDTPGYRALLREFFDRALKGRLQAEIYHSFKDFWNQHQALPPFDSLSALMPDQTQIVKQEWDMLISDIAALNQTRHWSHCFTKRQSYRCLSNLKKSLSTS